MSYILDALRRADAERARGAVPGLHAQNVPADGEPAARNFSPLIWAAGAAGVLVVAAVVVLVFGPWRSGPGLALAPDARVTPAPAPDLAAAARDNAPARLAQGELPPAQPGALDPAARPIEPPISRGNAVNVADARPPQDVAPAHSAAHDRWVDRTAGGRVATLGFAADARAPTPAARSPVEHYGAPVAAMSASTPMRGAAIPNINDLPAAVRSQLPHLAVGGAIYSETPAARMVILNGQVWREGDKPAADTVLEQIHPKSAVLNFRGQRYEVAF